MSTHNPADLHPRPLHSEERTALEESILRTLLYFDIFTHPLTVEEIFRFLPSNSTTAAAIRDALARPPLLTLINNQGGFYMLRSEESADLPVQVRLAKERRAASYWRVARFMARLIRHFPFVRGVFVSGELSKGIASRNGDIDFFIVTAHRRLWIARTALTLFKKTVLFNKKKFLCLNLYVSETSLEATNHNIYTALEVATLVPLVNRPLYLRYMENNSWITGFFPNLSPAQTHRVLPYRHGVLQRCLEFPFSGEWGDRIEKALLHFWKDAWVRRYPHYPEEERAAVFRTEPDISTAYLGNFLPKILSAYDHKLRLFGLVHSSGDR